MDAATSSGDTTVTFKNPKRFLGELDPKTTAKVIESAADIALILDKGVIRDIAIGNEDLVGEAGGLSWRGKSWIDTVTVESRTKVDDLLKDASAKNPRWRHVNHLADGRSDVPVKYMAVATPKAERVVAIGRDLRGAAVMQQRLVEAHQDLERDYFRLREAEARYKLLFESVSEAVIVVNASTLQIEEANPSAMRILGAAAGSLVGAEFPDLFLKKSRRAIDSAVAQALSAGTARAEGVALKNSGDCCFAASAFRQENVTRLIVRMIAGEPKKTAMREEPDNQILGLLEQLPDGLAVAGPDLRIVAANRAFVEMTHLVGKAQIIGARLSDYLGRSPTDLNVLVSSLKSHGVVRNFKTVLRDRFGVEEDVEVSGVIAPFDNQTAYGFSLRNVTRRLQAGAGIGDLLPNSVDRLTGLVGRVPLKEIVRESTDLIEKLCIEAALEITSDNRASAAEMLGLSRQGLYSKLRRFGIDDQG